MRWRFLTVGVVLAMAATGVARASNDPDWDNQYGPHHIYAEEAWAVSRGEGITIAVVDSGVQLDHPDLRDKLVPGYDFFDNDSDPNDENGHGTHVAGIAAASTDNGIGIAGVAPDSKVMPLKVFGAAGAYSLEDNPTASLLAIQQAISFAIDEGAEVINLSLGEANLGAEGFDSVSRSCLEAYNRGALCVAASGNEGLGKPSGYAHDFPGILVAATDRGDDVADFSQRADTKWSVAAPGVTIYSTWIDSGYQHNNGTSMATPHVAGLAALLYAQDLTIQQVIDKIIATATPLNDGGGTSGAGLVNAAAAVGASFTPTTEPPRAATTTTTRPALATGGGDDDDFTVVDDEPVAVDLTEGVVEEGDLVDAEGAAFEAAVGDDVGLVDIKESDGFTATFLITVFGFLGALGLVGFAARRLVLRRGIGKMRTGEAT